MENKLMMDAAFSVEMWGHKFFKVMVSYATDLLVALLDPLLHNEKGSAVTVYPSSHNVLMSPHLPHGLSHAWFLLAAGEGCCQSSLFLLGKAARLCPCLCVFLSQAVLSPLMLGDWEKKAIATVCLDLVSRYQTHPGFMLSENILKSFLNK
ncbi:hypothetical protein EK904_007026, partial [Melospiza melodia maxima]